MTWADRAVIAALTSAWALTGAMSMPDMQGGILTGLHPMATTPAMPATPGMEPSAGAGTALAAALFVATWW
jgi:hypothetical protein